MIDPNKSAFPVPGNPATDPGLSIRAYLAAGFLQGMLHRDVWSMKDRTTGDPTGTKPFDPVKASVLARKSCIVAALAYADDFIAALNA